MALKQQGLRALRNFLYRRYQKAGQHFRKVNRSFLRNVSGPSNPIKKAPSITSRYAGSNWKQLQPVWVLSTGRTGTHTLTELLKLSPLIDAWHEPAPELFGFSYDYYFGNIQQQEALRSLQYLRDELVFRSFRDGFVYIETNNRLAYLADLLLEAYPASKFVYIYRNPYSFIRSGMRRQYYHGHLRDPDRIIPTPDDEYAPRWQKMTDLEKVAWNWAAVNKQCLNFMEQLPENQGMQLSSEALFEAEENRIHALFDFVGSSRYHPPLEDINRVMGKKHNAQKKGAFSKADNWSKEQMTNVNVIIKPVANRLNYSLIPGEDD